MSSKVVFSFFFLTCKFNTLHIHTHSLNYSLSHFFTFTLSLFHSILHTLKTHTHAHTHSLSFMYTHIISQHAHIHTHSHYTHTHILTQLRHFCVFWFNFPYSRWTFDWFFCFSIARMFRKRQTPKLNQFGKSQNSLVFVFFIF